MPLETIGKIVLNVSFCLYLVLLLPQLLHNLLLKKTKSLSLAMHSILFAAYLTDWIYAFGREMPLQYKLVTVIGLSCLLIQHFQFYLQQKNEANFIKNYFFITTLLTLTFFVGIFGLINKIFNLKHLLLLESVSQVGWLSYLLPQIFINWRIKSIKGISLYFVLIAFFITISDSICAWTLNWDLPLKLGSPILFLIKLVLLGQFLLYRKGESKRVICLFQLKTVQG
jgi:uncharacterized protein with PQ loop repeat